jgi:pimeloyl-ACP methyl ester carboxylesterase
MEKFPVQELGKFRYKEAGIGPNILLLHPGAQTLKRMDQHMSLLAPTSRVVALDLYNIANRAIKPTFDNVAEGVYEFIVRKDLTDLTVLGYSLGGGVSLVLAANHPEAVNRVVCCEPVGHPVDRSLWAWWQGARKISAGSKLAFESMEGPSDHRSYLAEAIKLILTNPRGLKRAIGLATTADIGSYLDRIKVPVDFVLGRDSEFVPHEGCLEMARRISNSRLHLIDNKGADHNWFHIYAQDTWLPVVLGNSGSDIPDAS